MQFATMLRSYTSRTKPSMRKTTRQWLLFSLLCLLAPSSAASQTTLAITHASIIDAAGGPTLPDSTVLISGGRITAIGSSTNLAVPKGSQVVDATGKFLIPGLWDMHVHPEGKDYLPLFIANGVTGIRVMWGDPEDHEWRKAIEAGELIGPRMIIASPLVDGPKPYWRGSVSVSTEGQARQAVVNAKQAGADFVKVYQFLPRDLYFAIADEAKKQGIPFAGHVPEAVSAQEASSAGQKSFEHLVGVLPACSTHSDELLKAGQDDLAEGLLSKPKFWGPRARQLRQTMLDTYSPEKVAALSAVLKSNGTWQVPTLTLLRMFAYGDDPAFLNDPRLKYLPIRTRSSWDPAAIDGKQTPDDFAYMKREFQKDLDVVGVMQKSGVGILAGTDTANPFCFPGFSLHDELGLLVRAGLSPLQALQAATVSPARFQGREKDLGTIEKGKIADLVVLDANPLGDIGNTKKIFAVVSAGKLYSRNALDQMLANVEAIANRQPIGELLFKTIQEKGIEEAVKQYRELKSTQPAAYDFQENEFIGLGYHLLSMKKWTEAIEIFKLSVEAYPQSYNTYDSLAEAYMDNGDKELAIKNYKLSLQLKPDNTNAVERLKKLAAQ
jgi:imidazolonepropionase-like amidohydrolase